jgi:hypothetical protein
MKTSGPLYMKTSGFEVARNTTGKVSMPSSFCFPFTLLRPPTRASSKSASTPMKKILKKTPRFRTHNAGYFLEDGLHISSTSRD